MLFVSSYAEEHGSADATEASVRATYRQVLKRSADAAGLDHYLKQLHSGSICVRDIVRDLMHSDEWEARFIAGRAVEETVLALYDCVLARAPDTEGWNQLTAWEPRNTWASVIDSMIDGVEYTERFGDDLVPGNSLQPQS